jgi:hypothetical protein
MALLENAGKQVGARSHRSRRRIKTRASARLK